MVLLKVRKDVKLTTLGGRLFQTTATRSLKVFTHVELALIYDLRSHGPRWGAYSAPYP